MPRIAHLADVHLRSLSRHNEFRIVFDDLSRQLREKYVDLIFIAGDIFHTKVSGISPEYIDFLSNWLTELAVIAPVHMTLGNHDGTLTNLTRQDAVSPIVSALNNDRIKLYKDSGVYPIFPGVNLCVFSLFDEDGWINVKPVENSINIATYHGPVLGAFSDDDYAFDRGLPTSFFDSYQFVMLGDIHRQQHLAYRNTTNGVSKPWISYPGSTIQQNYAEALDHGYLLWDIKSSNDWDVDFNLLPNPKPFTTIEWDGDVENFKRRLRIIPQQSRVRIKSDLHLSQQDISLITATTNTLSPTEITFKIDAARQKDTVSISNVKLDHVNIRDPRILLKLVKDYYTDAVKDIQDDVLLSNIKNYLSQVTSGEDIIRGSRWSLKELRFDNTFAYGPNNVINFENLHGVTGIFAQNSAGKSSILGTLMYALFNSSDRGSLKNQFVCNIRHPKCSTRATINVDGTDYVIERETTKHENKKGGQHATTSLSAWRLEKDGELSDLCGDARADTEKVIRSLLGTADDILLTSLSSQGKADIYVEKGSTSRRQVLTRFLDLDIFDKMHKIVNEDVKAHKAQLRSFPDRDWDVILNTLSKEQQDCDANTRSISEEIENLIIEISSTRHKLTQHSNVEPVTEVQIKTQQSYVEKLEKQLETIIKTINDVKDKIASGNTKIEKINNIKSEYNVNVLKEQHKVLTRLQKDTVSTRHAHDKANSQLKVLNKAASTLSSVPCGDKYLTCRFIKDAHEAKQNINTQTKAVEELHVKLQACELQLKSLDVDIEDKLTKLQRLDEMLSETKIQSSKSELELNKLEIENKTISDKLVTSRLRLNELQTAYELLDNVEIVTLRNELSTLDKKKTSLESERLRFARLHGTLEERYTITQNERRQRNDILKEMQVTDLLLAAFSKKGIPNEVVSSQLPAINAEIAKILHGIVGFSVQFEIADGSDDLDLYIDYGDSRRIIETTGGMEKLVSSIAIRVALANVSTLPRSDIFVIDEGFGALDDVNLEAGSRLITSLTKYFKKVIIISHIGEVKDIVDNVLEVIRVEKDAKVVSL